MTYIPQPTHRRSATVQTRDKAVALTCQPTPSMQQEYDIAEPPPASETTQIGRYWGDISANNVRRDQGQRALSGLGGASNRDVNEFRKRSRIGLLHNGRPVGFDCSLANAERVSDYLVGFSLKDQFHDLVLAECQCSDTFRRGFVP